jgi:hypothetical protein
VVVDDQLPQSGVRLSLDELGMTTVGRA